MTRKIRWHLMKRVIGNGFAALSRLGRANLRLLRPMARWWRATLQDVAFFLIGLGYLILSLTGTDHTPPPSAPAA